MLCNTQTISLAKVWPLQSPVKDIKYTTSKNIEVRTTAYIIRCWRRLLQPNSQNWKLSLQWRYSQPRADSITAAQCSIRYSLLTPVEVQSASRWQHYCSTVLKYLTLASAIHSHSIHRYLDVHILFMRRTTQCAAAVPNPEHNKQTNKQIHTHIHTHTHIHKHASFPVPNKANAG